MTCPYKPTCQRGVLEPKQCEPYKICELYQLLKARDYPFTFTKQKYNKLEKLLKRFRK